MYTSWGLPPKTSVTTRPFGAPKNLHGIHLAGVSAGSSTWWRAPYSGFRGEGVGLEVKGFEITSG